MKVVLIAETKVLYNPTKVSDLEYLATLCGKVCVGQRACNMTDLEVEDFIDRIIIGKGHHGLLEHWHMTVHVSDCSRSFTNQLVRHRIATYDQLSQRYTECFTSDNFIDDVVIPEKIKANPWALEVFKETIDDCAYAYHKLIDIGIKREDARAVVPMCYKTEIFVTWNARTIKDVLKLRYYEKGAQGEFQEFMRQLLNIIRNIGSSRIYPTQEEYRGSK